MAAEAKESMKLSREDYFKKRELEELRKLGQAAPAVDEDGKMINPHIPEYMSKAPWYATDNENQSSLKHQTLKANNITSITDGVKMDQWYDRRAGARTSGDARGAKFRKGACENCGAVTHKRKDCLERPRKRNAKKQNKTLAVDEKALPTLNLDYASKRDRWNGFDATSYQRVVDRFAKKDEQLKKQKEKELEEEFQRKKRTRATKLAAKVAKLRAREERRDAGKAKKAAALTAANPNDAPVAAADVSSDSGDSDSDSDSDSDDEDAVDSDLFDAGRVITTDKSKGVNDGVKTTSRK
jgi:pre-mRNA-processing factor SLU7